jgi:hypothetical protein
MRRILVGTVWFFALWLGFSALGGGIVGAVASIGADPSQAAQLGTEAGTRFGAQYGGILFLCSLAVATVGTLFGWLPGTRRS